jgi:TatD DNase family protein
MKLVDTHTHIYLPEFEADRIEMLKRADNEGVKEFYLPAIDAATHQRMLDLEASHPDSCHSMMGLHPCSVKADYLEELAIVRKYLDQRPFVAIGEIGLDFYWDKTFTDQQFDAFRTQIAWALELNIPIVIHSRNSTDECIAEVKAAQHGKLRGIFHCFSGNAEQAKQITDLGFLLGIGGVLTFKNSGLDKAIADIPLEYLVLETDAPYLAPVPYRGKRNEPAYLKYVVDKISDIKECSREIVAAVTTANAEKLFNPKLPDLQSANIN